MRSVIFSFLAIATQSLVFACEGECIVGITNAWLGNYTVPINRIFRHMADQIAEQLIPPHASLADPSEYLEPILDFYSTQAYEGMRHAIFPSFFHGKCQNPETGLNPPGCPNPDCATVCGTPGSLVHFYPHLRYIAFNQTRHLFKELVRSGTDATRAVEDLVLADAVQPKERTIYRFGWLDKKADGRPHASHVSIRTERELHIKTQLKHILGQVGPLLEQACGGSGGGSLNGLPDCSWENNMKEYILTFP